MAQAPFKDGQLKLDVHYAQHAMEVDMWYVSIVMAKELNNAKLVEEEKVNVNNAGGLAQ